MKVSSILLPCGAWALGMGSLWLDGLAPGGRSALVLGGFLLAAGMPTSGAIGAEGTSSTQRSAFFLAFAAGPLALALALDRAQGAGIDVLLGLLPGVIALLLLAAAAARPSIVYLIGWVVLGLGLPLARVVLELEGPVAELALATPLGFVFGRAANPAGGTTGDLSVVVVALLLAGASKVGRRAG